MGNGWRIGPMLLLLLVFTAFPFLTDGSPLEVMAAPQALRVGTPENIFVEIQDCTLETNIDVEIIIMNHPTKSRQLASTAVALSKSNSWQAFGQILIPAEDLHNYDNSKHYVSLQAVFPNKILEKVVLLSFRSEYLFIHTDKKVYTPDSPVYYRIFTLMNDFDDRNGMNQLDIEIVSPDGRFPLERTILSPPGAFNGRYQIDDVASPGLWKITAKFSNSPQLRFAAEFEVKEYVRPALSVKLTPDTTFFHVDGTKLTVYIEAKYVFGRTVDGVAFVLFGIQHAGQKKALPSSLQRVAITGGNGAATLWRGHITQTFADIQRLVGSSLYVTVTVLTEIGANMAEAELNGIKILTSPNSISLDKTMKYFKPGVPFDVEFQVLNPDNTPAEKVELVVEPGNVMLLSGANGFTKLSVNTQENTQKLAITIKTNVPAIPPHRQAAATLEALPYTSPSKSYIHIGADTADVKLGDNLKVQCLLKRHEYTKLEVTYLILSKGRLVNYFRWQGQSRMFISLIVPVTKEMIPSFYIIVYYHTSANEVVSDSLWVDVKHTCMGSLRVEKATPSSHLESGKILLLKITGTPRATVALTAHDKGLFTLNDGLGPTQKTMWDAVKQFEKYCTPGSGKDRMGVFYDAGLLFESSAGGTPHKKDLTCPSHNRRKRDIGEATGQEADNSYLDHEEIVLRGIFPESWLWESVVLPSCPRIDPNCETTSMTKYALLPDLSTNWEIIGISQSQTHGICVADPLEVTVRKDFFIDLSLPYSAVAGKQLEVKAVLHNYKTYPITVLVYFFEVSDVCSVAYKRGKYQQVVKVESQSSRSVPFVVIFTKTGEHSIEIKAAVKDSTLNDGIRKKIHVRPWGDLVKRSVTVTLDPVGKGVGGRQVEILNSQIPLNDMLPFTPTSTVVSVTGEGSSQSAESVISGNTMDNLIQQPSGYGVMNMVQMTLPVIATVYLDQTNQWEMISFGTRDKALGHIETGYRNQLASRKTDGSFSAFRDQPSSTWLTAYVAKVFTMAKSLIPVHSSAICDAVKFLILNRQRPDGHFAEDPRVKNGDMTGDVFGADSAASLTSFCLIALQESRPLCAPSVNSLPQSILSAVSYLESRLPALSNPYAVAISSYALANENRLNKDTLYRFAAPGRDHWAVPKGNVYQLEATAYALLALVKAEALEEARPVVSWLRRQQRVNGGYISHQATMMVYQAVAEYSTRAKEMETKEYDLSVEVLLPHKIGPFKYYFGRQNSHVTRRAKSKIINQNITVTATGKGRAALKMVSLYYAVPKETEPHCQKFNLSVQLIPVSTDEAEKVYKLRIDVLYLNKDRDATMVVLDIGLLTGFSVNSNDLNLLSQSRSRIISKYERNTVLSERGSLLIYLDKVSHRQPEEITFRIHQKLKHDVFQPAAVSVYEHDDRMPCVKFYHPERTAGQLLQLCTGEECVCAEENCGVQKRGGVTSEQRIEKSCEVSHAARTAFVYKVRLEEFNGDLPTHVYKMTILDVIREGNNDVGVQGKMRIFFSPKHCRESLNLVKGKTYLVMGVSRDIYMNNQEQSYQYALSERTWLEYWPTAAECLAEQHRPTCVGIEKLVQQQLLFGCL